MKRLIAVVIQPLCHFLRLLQVIEVLNHFAIQISLKPRANINLNSY